MSASSREEDINVLYADSTGNPRAFEGTVRDRYNELADEGDRLNGYSKASFIAAGVTAGAAIVFFILDATSSSSDEKVSSVGRTFTPVVSRSGLGFVAGWEF